MSFSCPPAELVSSLLESLAFSGQHGITLSEMWDVVSTKLQSSLLDNFQKQVVWQWLFFYNQKNEPLHSYIAKGDVAVTILPNYMDILEKEGSEETLYIIPSADTQWKYLTGLSNSKKLKLQLGEHPFHLLCEISKYGSEGIYSPDLCKATGQDPRSLPLRLRKLEEFGLIKKKNVYNEKTSQHTSLCVHIKFANEEVQSASSDFEDDFEASRNVHKLKQFIMHSVKNAPNGLRGFKDLKSELKLDKNQSSSKFFRGIVEFLHTHGYIERLMVKDPNDSRLVYCIKYIKNIPKDSNEISDYVDVFTSLNEDQYRYQDEEEVEATRLPTINKFFPISSQIYQSITSMKKSGLTSMEITRNLTGVSDYRPFIKLLDALTSFVLDDTKLKPLRNYSDPYSDISVVRAYDFEGKFKFYRYFSKVHQLHLSGGSLSRHQEEIKSSKLNASLEELNKTLHKPLSKVPQGSLVGSKKRKLGGSDGDLKTKRLKSKKVDEKTERRTRGRPRKDVTSLSPSPMDSEKLVPEEKVSVKGHRTEDQDAKMVHEIDSSATASINDIEPINPPIEKIQKIRRKQASSTSSIISSGSLKASKRRSALIDIIKEMGGVTYTTTKLCRLLDEKLGNSTITDKKTLARDVSILIANNELEVQNIIFIRSGQKASRKLLILNHPGLRPSDGKIQEMKKQCVEDNGTKLNFQMNRRVIEGEVTLYSQPIVKPGKTKKGNRTARLESLVENDKKLPNELNNHDENVRDSTSLVSNNEDMQSGMNESAINVELKDPLSSLVSKKHKRKRKPRKKDTAANNFVSKPSRRFRTSIKFDTTDATTLFRAVVISKTFKRGTIDFDKIASLFNEFSAKEIKQKWTMVRKQVGGLPAVIKGTEEFEHIVMKGIDDGLVSSDDLENIKFDFFLDLWRDADNSVLDIIDKTPLYTSVTDNLNEYNKIEYTDHQQDLFEQLEDNSMRQKEAILSGTSFYYHKKSDIQKKEHDELRTVLKAIFSTSEDNFSSNKVTQLLSEFGEEDTQQASSALIKEKEISYYSLEDSNTRFILTDKVHNTFVSKIFTNKFFNQASAFKENLASIATANKGLILSQGISSGQMASLLDTASNGMVKLARIDRAYEFNGYESRLIDKDKLSCDIIVIADKKLTTGHLTKIPVPIGKACSHIWLDLNGNINSQMWIKIVISILYYIHFRPGVLALTIYNKMQAVLGYSDFFCVMNWLIDSKCINKGEDDGYWVNNEWYSILGY